MGVQVGFIGGSTRFASRQAWLWPLNHSGPAVALGGKQRFCTSERIRPIRLMEIDFGAAAPRAMWGYGVDPPPTSNPHLGLVSRMSPRSGRHCSRRRLSWCSWLCTPASAPCWTGRFRGAWSWPLLHQLHQQDRAGNGAFLTSRRHRDDSARYLKGPP
jgi:hypothetical protein